MIRKQEATGKTVDEARAKACALLGVQADDLNVSCEVLEMPQKTGFLGLKLTPAKVCVSVEEPDAPAAAPAEPVVEKKTPVQEAVKACSRGRGSLPLRQHSRKQRPKSLLPPLQKLLQCSSPLPRKRRPRSPHR